MHQLEIALKRADDIIGKLDKPLGQYCWIQAHVNSCDVQSDAEFQRKFNGFYIVRRNKAWRDAYYSYFESAKKSLPSFEDALRHMFKRAGRIEASFVSKMIATLDTTVPVIDVYVLKYFGLALPYQNVSDRLKKTAEVYAKLCAEYQKIMVSREARIICDKFDRRFPSSGISDIKKVDFILWQIRD